MTYLVIKFGGTSVGSAERIKHVAQLIQDGEDQVVVFSAVSGTTNALVEIANHLYKNEKQEVNLLLNKLDQHYQTLVEELYAEEASKEQALIHLNNHWTHIRSFTLDMFTRFEERAVLAQGELISSMLIKLYFDELKVESTLLNALDFMRVDPQSEPDQWYIQSNLQRLMKDAGGKGLFITQGFICRNHFGEVDNLKRGGSDYSASIIGAAIGAEEVQIWTDIDGMHNNDPRIVKDTKPIERF